MAPLEDRFPQPPTDLAPPDGIIVLGSAVNGRVSKARGQTVFDEGERATEAALLAKRYPDARVVYSGGNGSLISTVSTEALAAKRFLSDLGVDPARVTLEDRSRNTDENARFTAALVHPQPSQRWLLVTSAFHMPRSMGVFEKAGFNVIAFPVALSHAGRRTRVRLWDSDPARNLRTFEIAHARVDRPRRLLGDRADRAPVSRAGRRGPPSRFGTTHDGGLFGGGAPRR